MLNKRKNKSFNYKPRYSKNDIVEKGTAQESNSILSGQWLKTRRTGNKNKTSSRLIVLLLLLGIIIAVFYYLETQIG